MLAALWPLLAMGPLVLATASSVESRLDPPATKCAINACAHGQLCKTKISHMLPGVQMHYNRKYTYDVVPDEVHGGVLFVLPHQMPMNVSISFRCAASAAARLYVAVHKVVDGGYIRVLDSVEAGAVGWQRSAHVPQYSEHEADSLIMWSIPLARDNSEQLLVMPRTSPPRPHRWPILLGAISFILVSGENSTRAHGSVDQSGCLARPKGASQCPWAAEGQVPMWSPLQATRVHNI
mmetsp:Transcript_37792/g.88428  ORF Transcript_37792/g.88428 Transcript_37792/m.88428 type:complete len:236 (-) Transcript_37792:76-783(-)